MSDVKQDIYETNQSSTSSIGNIGEQIKVDLKLKSNPNDLNGGIIKGTIKNINGNPIKNAYVKLLSNKLEPLRHTISNEDGNYILAGIPEETYIIMVRGTEYNAKEKKDIIIENKKEITIDFTLDQDRSQSNAIIVGKVMNFSNGQAVEGAVVSLYEIDTNNEKSIKALSYSNEYGEFSFRNIPQENYNILINTLGYKSTNIDVSITIPGQIIPIEMYITENPFTSRGTVSGMILDNNTKKPINRADVILYEVQKDNSLKPVANTKTNKNGIYLFINVPGGTYKVKSNNVEIVDVDIDDTLYRAPDFKSFTLETLGAFTPLKFYAKNGILENSAKINSVTDYVTNLGGNDNGEVTLLLPAIEFPYELGFQYLASSDKQYLKLSINGEIKNLTLPITDSMDPKSSKEYSLTTNLHAGMNSIKFFNDNGRLAPDINEVTLKMLPYTKDFLAKDGDLALGATVSPETGYVMDIGFVKFKILVPIGGKYEFQIQYLSGDKNRQMAIQVTDMYGNIQNKNYSFSKTNSFNVDDARFFTTTLIFAAGNNDVYFLGNSTVPSPYINIIKLKKLFLKEDFSVKDVQLFNGAEIENGLITNIVGGLGYMVLTANIYGTYSYNLILEYISKTGTNVCYIDINGKSTGEKYFFETTGDTPKKKIIPLTLGAGENKIKIYNPSKEDK